MTRINTNVSSLIAQNTLSRNNNDLSQSLQRLSTGLRINSGADDPAGLIASENLRRDITDIERAVSNSERAGQLIATADSALGQVSSLLNDIRGLVTEAANTGVLSDEQVGLAIHHRLEGVAFLIRSQGRPGGDRIMTDEDHGAGGEPPRGDQPGQVVFEARVVARPPYRGVKAGLNVDHDQRR